MIDEKKLIEKLNRLESIVADYRSDVRQGYLNLICEIKDFVNEQPRVNQWIPCSERLPEANQMVLATENDSVIICCYEYIDGHGYCFCGSKANVLAWMPLPQPYQEEKDE